MRVRESNNIMYSQCVCVRARVQGAERTRHIMSSVCSLAEPYFSTYLMNGTIFEKRKLTEQKMF